MIDLVTPVIRSLLGMTFLDKIKHQNNNSNQSKAELAAYFVLQLLSIYIGFGSIFFVAFVFYYLYKPTKKSEQIDATAEFQPKLVAVKKNKKKRRENVDMESLKMSAYSVFNKNGENMTGTLTAAQLEKEMRRN